MSFENWQQVRATIRKAVLRRVKTEEIPVSDLDDVTQELTSSIWYAVEIEGKPIARQIWRAKRRKAILRAWYAIQPGEQCETPERWEDTDYASSAHYVRKYGLYDLPQE